MPAVELAWRLAHPFWGKGYATEGARASVTFAGRVSLPRDDVSEFCSYRMSPLLSDQPCLVAVPVNHGEKQERDGHNPHFSVDALANRAGTLSSLAREGTLDPPRPISMPCLFGAGVCGSLM